MAILFLIPLHLPLPFGTIISMSIAICTFNEWGVLVNGGVVLGTFFCVDLLLFINSYMPNDVIFK